MLHELNMLLLFVKVTLETSLGQLSRVLDNDHFALVVHDQRQCKYLNVNLLPTVKSEKIATTAHR